MRIWLVQTGEEMPIDGAGTRLLRTALLAEELVRRGHDVTYFNASFNHQRKIQRSHKSRIIEPNRGFGNNYRIVLLGGCSYRNNVSIRRFISHHQNAAAFKAIVSNLPKPDIIMAGFPPIELAWATVQYANSKNIPVAIDCRDMWPDIIAKNLPTVYKLVANLPLFFMERTKRKTLKRASYITGITDSFVAWGLNAASRTKTKYDRAFHLAVSPNMPVETNVTKAHDMWDKVLGKNNAGRIVACFAGTLSDRLDIGTLLDGIDRLSDENRSRIRIVMCGKGNMESIIRNRAKTNDAIIFGGWCNSDELTALMQRAQFGVLPYPNTDDFLSSYPNKVGEYLLAGLPIMTGLQGLTGTLLRKASLNIEYEVGSADSFAKAIITILKTKDFSAKKILAKKTGKEFFDPAKIYPDFSDWLESLVTAGAKNDR